MSSFSLASSQLKFYLLLASVLCCVFISSSADANSRFMPLNPNASTLINGKKFMGLGGGQDPIRLARQSQEFRSLKQSLAALPEKKETPLAITIPAKEQVVEPEIAALEKPAPLEQAHVIEEQQIASLNLNDTLPFKSATILRQQADRRQRQTKTHIWPVDEQVTSRISSPYGKRIHPITGELSFHEGLDIAAPIGTAVIASNVGEITDLGRHRNLGNYVKVSHADGTYSLYGHLSKITAHIGHNVAQGEKIGEVGSTGRSTGPHLDYSLRRDGKSFNPQNYLVRNEGQHHASLR